MIPTISPPHVSLQRVGKWGQAGRISDMHECISALICASNTFEGSAKAMARVGSVPGGDFKRILSWLRRAALATQFDALTMQHYSELQAKWQVMNFQVTPLLLKPVVGFDLITFALTLLPGRSAVPRRSLPSAFWPVRARAVPDISFVNGSFRGTGLRDFLAHFPGPRAVRRHFAGTPGPGAPRQWATHGCARSHSDAQSQRGAPAGRLQLHYRSC